MAFLKIENLILNTAYIAAVELDNQLHSGEVRVYILMVTPKFPAALEEGVLQNSCRYEWLEFTGSRAKALQDYFSSFNNVVDLLPQSYTPVECIS